MISDKYDGSDEYFENWIDIDKIKDIDRLLKLLTEHHNKDMERRKDEIENIMEADEMFRKERTNSYIKPI